MSPSLPVLPAAGSPATDIVPAAAGAGLEAVRPAREPVIERPPFVPPGAIPPADPPPGVTEPDPAKGPRNRVVLAGITVALAVIGTAAVLGYLSFSQSDTPVSPPDPIPSVDVVLPEPTETSSPPPTPSTTTVLNSERTDPRKLTLKEAFARQRVTVGGRSYLRARVDITGRCHKVATGAFATALKRTKCSRVLRATYVDGKRRYAVTTGIAVFPTRRDAVAADKKKNLAKTVWFRGLAGGPGSGADKAAISGGYASGLVWGRYIVFSFATYSDGHTPTGPEKDLGPVSGAFRDHTAQVIEKRATSG